jgi:hypothetical protein
MATYKKTGTTSAYSSDINANLSTQRASGMLTETQNQAGSMAIATTNIEVMANGFKVGFIQSLSPSENRNIIKVQELGTEGVVQSVPSNTNGGQLQVSRFALYNSSLWRALGLTTTGDFKLADATATSGAGAGTGSTTNPFKTLRHQRTPIEISVKTKTPHEAGGSNAYYEEVYLDCWLSSYSKTVASNTITITEQATIQYSDALFRSYKIPKFDAGGAGDRTNAYGYTPNVSGNDNTVNNK